MGNVSGSNGYNASSYGGGGGGATNRPNASGNEVFGGSGFGGFIIISVLNSYVDWANPLI